MIYLAWSIAAVSFVLLGIAVRNILKEISWISVKNKLPELIPNDNGAASEYVLVFLSCKVKDPQTMMWKAYYTNDGWAYEYGDLMTIEDANAITHWQPLPPPPTH